MKLAYKITLIAFLSTFTNMLLAGLIHTPEIYHQKNYTRSKSLLLSEMVSRGKYQCCLEKPCAYCLEKTPAHGEGASCTCLKDVINGDPPCGECIGEILEGHGNRFLAKYFARSLASELGENYLKPLKNIIAVKYHINPSEQI